MYVNLGTVRPGSTVFVPFHTFDSNDPSASVTITGLATTDIEVYKDASMTQRASDSGYALVDTDGIDLDTITGIHGVTIDLSDNTTAGFWAAGSDYVVVISSITVDAATINFIPIRFRIGYEGAVLNTTIATLASQTSFTLTTGPAEDDALNGMWCWIHDVASAVQCGYAVISDYTGSTRTVTLAAATTFTAAASDNISIMGPMPMQPTVAGTQSVAQTGDNYARLGAPAGASIAADIAQVDTVVDGIQTDLSNGTDGLGAIKTAVDAIPTSNPTAAAIADQVWDEVLSGHLTAGTTGEALNAAGAAGDPWTTTLPGSYTGSQAGKMLSDILTDTADLQANQGNWLTATGFSTHSATDVWAAATRTLTANTNLNDPTAAAIADAVWDELQSGHVTGGSFGEIATEIASILADTNELQTDWTNGGRLDLIVDGILEDTGTTLPASISGLNNLSAAQVNAEVLDVLATDTFAEPASVPAATASLKDKIGWLAALARNKLTSTATTQTLRNDADSASIGTSTHSDDGTTFTRGEWS